MLHNRVWSIDGEARCCHFPPGLVTASVKGGTDTSSASIRKSQYLHIESPWMFDVDRWFHLAWPARVPHEAHDDIVQGMQEARAAWLKHAESTLLAHPSQELRDMLGRSGNRFHMKTMDNHQVAKALYNEVKDGNLLFVPERDPIRKCMEAIPKQREKGTRQAPADAQEPTGGRGKGAP